MRIAVLADIHGNLPALEAVTKDLDRVGPDLVVVAGDFQNRGPQPREVTELVAGKGWRLLRGNHEDYVIRQSQPSETLDVADDYSWLPARWTAEQTRHSLEWIRSLPIAIRLEGPEDSAVTIAHGSPRSNAEGFFPSTSEEKAIAMIGNDPPRVLCCGHSHFPLLIKVNSTLVFNVGSVGFPFDGDLICSGHDFGHARFRSSKQSVRILHCPRRRSKCITGVVRGSAHRRPGRANFPFCRVCRAAGPAA
ncbi:MAG: metallophosphoesterase [Chthoniobacterales bacterium]